MPTALKQLSKERTLWSAYHHIEYETDADTTDAEISEALECLEAMANKDGFTLDLPALREAFEAKRKERQSEVDE